MKLSDFWKHVDIRDIDDCWNWKLGLDTKRYGTVSIDGVTCRANRIAFLLYHGYLNNLFVCHSCDNPTCCNPYHLWLGTSRENTIDYYSKKDRPRTKIKKSDIPIIHSMYNNGMFQKDIAKKFGVIQPTISMILTRRNWKWLK